MFLSRVELGPRAAANEAFWREVTQPYGAHQALWRLLGRSADQKRDFLFRSEDGATRPSFLVLSSLRPVGDAEGLWSIVSKPFEPRLQAGSRLGFRLRASPVVRRSEPAAEGASRRAHRHDVVMDRKKRLAAAGQPLPAMPELVTAAGQAWLRQQGSRAGFQLVETHLDEIGDEGLMEATDRSEAAVRVEGYQQHRIARRGETPIRFSSLDFEGLLEVTDPAAFLARVRAGFGPQKAFGCGLMLLRRA